MIGKGIFIVSILFIAGCAQIKPLSLEQPVSMNVVDKNYTKGARQTVYVGQAMVRSKDYHVVESVVPMLEASNDFEIRGPLAVTFRGSEGQKYSIRGETELDGNAYKAFVVQTYPCFTGLIDESGRFSKTMLSGMGCTERNLYNWNITPESTRFNLVRNKKVDSTAGFSNFELLYGGTNGNSFNVSYREYTPNDLARPAFFQDLTFNVKSEFIRYKNIRIKIFDVTDEGIEYAVVED